MLRACESVQHQNSDAGREKVSCALNVTAPSALGGLARKVAKELLDLSELQVGEDWNPYQPENSASLLVSMGLRFVQHGSRV